MVLRSDSKNAENVHPEVYMVSDEGQELVVEGLVHESEKRGYLKVKGDGA
jgi:hypothetical protein